MKELQTMDFRKELHRGLWVWYGEAMVACIAIYGVIYAACTAWLKFEDWKSSIEQKFYDKIKKLCREEMEKD